MSEDKGRPLPKFGEWDVNDPASAEGFTVIFNKARDEKKTGGKPDSPAKFDSHTRSGVSPSKAPAVKKMVLLLSKSNRILMSSSSYERFQRSTLHLQKTPAYISLEKVDV
ncbi:protein NOI4-like isoform X2 [Tripterygium wilfordii]|uniref:protein NOI4-like isoform X2 n=1 Tax=Tripterygium wilfordii TaxID=458696 RepID=UPI0018F7F199|nr:protein NOI4-like isoform X2 [Tripterygium wilfordii]